MKGIKPSRLFKVFSMILVCVALGLTAFLSMSKNTVKKANLSTTSYDLSNTVDINYMLFETNGENATFVGLSQYGSSYDESLEYYQDKTLEIPSRVNLGGATYTVTAIDTSKSLSSYIYLTQNDVDYYMSTLYRYGSNIHALVIPESVTSINQGAFYGMAELEYMKTPFIGVSRGLDNSNYQPLHSMFSYGYYKITNDTYQPQFFSQADYSIISTYQSDTIWYYIAETNPLYYTLPSNLSVIEITDETEVTNRPFFSLDSVKSITFSGTSLTTVSEYMFAGCSNLTFVSLPNSITTLYEGMFSQCFSLEEFVVPANTYTIPENFLAQCTSLKKVYISTNITTIGNKAFYKCENLEQIVLYSTLNDGTIQYISSSEQYCLPTGLETIGDKAFGLCYNLTSINIPGNVKSIGEGAFEGCYNLTNISLPFVGSYSGYNQSEINKANFGYIFGTSSTVAGCYIATQNGHSYYIPEKLRSITITSDSGIYANAFSNLSYDINSTPCGVETINILNNEGMTIGNQIFAGSTALKDISIPFIGGSTSNAFYTMFGKTSKNGTYSANGYFVPSSLERVTITSQEIYYTGQFYYLSSIKYLELGDTCELIWNSIFYGNYNLEELVLPFVGICRGNWGSSKYYNWDYGRVEREWSCCLWTFAREMVRNSMSWLFSTTYHTNTYTCYGEYYHLGKQKRYVPMSLSKITITDDTTIPTYAFRNMSYLTDITITGASYINGGCMYGCSSLVNLSVPFIGKNANVNGLNGEGFTLGWCFGSSGYSGSYAANQGYGTYYIPESLISVTINGDSHSKVSAYAFSNMSSVETLNLSNCVLYDIGAYAFNNCKLLKNINYNANSSITSVGAYAFNNCVKISSIKQAIPSINSVQTSLGDNAMAGTSISEIDFTRFTSVGNYCFSGCLLLTSVNVTSNLSSVGKYLFANCLYLNNATLAQGLVSEGMFMNCITLTSIDLTNTIVSGVLPASIFEGCTSLEFGSGKLVLPSTITTIGEKAFKDCVSLTNFTIPSNVTTIGKYAFYGCDYLSPIIIPKNVTTISSDVFTTNIGNGFGIYVYYPEENWPKGWTSNWNCLNPVYYLGDNSEYVYIFEFDEELIGYRIIGIKEGFKLESIVKLPATYNALPVYAVDEDVFVNQIYVTKIVIPSNYKIFGEGCFTTGKRIDLYFEAKKGASGVPSTSEELSKLITAGLVFYGNTWEYSSSSSDKVIPYVKLSSLKYKFKNTTLYYTGSAHTPDIVQVDFDAIAVSDDNLGEISTTIYSSKKSTWKELFNYVYKDNISAGTAYANVSVNSSTYNNYITNTYSQYLTGTAKATFTINKADIDVYLDYSTESLCREYTLTYYPGQYWSNNVWGNDQITGIDLSSGYTFTGTLKTTSDDAGVYLIVGERSNSDFYWSSEPRVYYKGVNVTTNYNILVNLKITVEKLDVELKWTGGTLADDDVYEYEYTGKEILPSVVAYTKEGVAMNKCEIVVKNSTGVAAIYPTSAKYTAYAYISANSAKNYNIINSDADSDGRIYTLFRVVNANIVINVYYESLMLEHDALNVELNITGNTDNIYISGLASSSKISGTIISTAGVIGTAHDKKTYTAGSYTTQGYDDTIIWQSKTYSDITYNGFTYPKLDFLIYRYDSSGNIIVENDYYNVTLEASITVVYDEFEVDYYFDGELLTNGYYKIVNNKKYLYFEIEVDGESYEFTGKVSNVDISLHAAYYSSNDLSTVGYSTLYYYDDGNYEGVTPPTVQSLGYYYFGFGVNAGTLNLDSYYEDIIVNAVKSNIKFNSLDKEYDGEPVNLDNFIAKKAAEQTVELTIYDSTKKNIIDPPTVPGTYYVYVVADETDYFNSYDGFVKFVISPRTINIYVDKLIPEDSSSTVNETGYYNGEQYAIVIDNEKLHELGVVLENDTFTGTLLTRSSVPGVYDTSVDGDWYWLSGWSVYNKSGYDYTSYYKLVLHGSYTIKELIISLDSVEGYSGTFDGAYHSITVNVNTPSSGYKIYYTFTEVNKYIDSIYSIPWLSYNPPIADVGTYKVYFKVVCQYYETYYGSATIEIKAKEIKYSRPADFIEDDSGNLYIDYDGLYHSLEISVSDPMYATVYYKFDYEEDYYTDVPFKSELGTYTLAYYIVADNYGTVYGSYTFTITESNLPDSSSLGIHVDDVNITYDGNYHEVNVFVPSGYSYIIYYHTDSNTTWTTMNPSYIDAGYYKVYVRVCITGYKSYSTYGTITILEAEFEDVDVEDYEGDYDGEYHGITITGLDKYPNATVYYTDSSAIAYSGNLSLWSTTPITVKNSGITTVFVYITMANYESITKIRTITINQADVEIDYEDGYEVEYKKDSVTVDDLGITTIHDGVTVAMYFNATIDDSGKYVYNANDRIQAPSELGNYVVVITYKATTNCYAKTIEFGFTIVPRKITVIYTESVEYNGYEQGPNPTCDSGTSDKLQVLYDRTDGSEDVPIEVGEYEVKFTFSETTKNYVIVNPIAIFTITKIQLIVEIDTEMDYEDGVYWTSPEVWDSYKFTERLLYGHTFAASMITTSYQRGTYIYTTLTDAYYLNTVRVKNYYVYDENGENVADKYYDIYFNITVNIVFPKLNVNLHDTTIEFDGEYHGLDIEIDQNTRDVTYFYADQYDYLNGDWLSSPITYKECGTYLIYILIVSPLYEDYEGYATLTITKAYVKFEIDEFDEMYSGDLYQISYTTNLNCLTSSDVDVKYYSTSKFDASELIELYKNLDKTSSIYKDGLESIIDAGEYYVMLYVDGSANWYDSYGSTVITLNQRPIYFSIDPTYEKEYEYNGDQRLYYLTDATIKEESLIDLSRINHSIDSVISFSNYSVRTISANSSKDGYRVYDGASDFEFNYMIINNSVNQNVYYNFKPVFDEGDLKITIKSIELDEFKVEDYVKYYDGKPANPTIITPSDGDITYIYYRILDDGSSESVSSISSCNVGKYLVLCTIGAGTNYKAWSKGYVSGNVTINARSVTLEWEDLTVEFNGHEQSPKAYFIDVFGDKTYVDVYILLQGDFYDSVLNANLYEVYAQTSDSNYDLSNTSNLFEITKLIYTIKVSADHYNPQATWKYYFDENDIDGILSNLIITNSAKTDKGLIQTISSIPSTYIGTSSFTTDICVMADGVNVTDSIDFEIDGTVVIHSYEIDFTTVDVEIEYDGLSHNVWEGITLYNPINKSEVTIMSALDSEAYTTGVVDYTDVGTYIINFKLSSAGYDDKYGSLTITIKQIESFLNTGKVVLDKEYDNIPVSTSYILNNVIGYYNGTDNATDLKVEYYEAGDDTPMETVPIDAGDYEYVITCKNDDDESYVKNYSQLYVRRSFTISPKGVNLVVSIDKEISITDSAEIFTTGSVKDVTANGLGSYTTLTYEIASIYALSRGTYSYEGEIYDLDGSSSTFYCGTDLFGFTWNVVASDRSDEDGNDLDVSYNYYIILEFELVIHLPYMDILIEDVTSDYTGEPIYGEVYYGGSYPGISGYFYNIDESINGLDISSVSYVMPGTYKVYYTFTCYGYEDFSSSYTIKINFIDRKYTVDDEGLNKEFDEIAISNPTYKLSYSDGMPTDDYNLSEVTYGYQKVGTVDIVDSVVDAGKYIYYITIPATDYYNKTVIEGTFTISRKTVYIVGTYNYSYNGKQATYSDFTKAQSNFKFYYSDGTSADDVTIYGTLSTTMSAVRSYTSKDGTLSWSNGTYVILKGTEDVTTNYQASLTDCILTILPGNIEYEITDNKFEYSPNVYHKITAYSTNPVGATVYYSTDGVNYSTTYKGFNTVGTHTLYVKFVMNNYNDQIVQVTVSVDKATLQLECIDLSKTYDGVEVLLVGMQYFSTNCPDLTFTMILNSSSYLRYDEENDSWYNMENTRPINVGLYQLVVELVPFSENYTGGEFKFEFEISPMKAGIMWSDSSFIYNGEVQYPKATVYNPETGNYIQDLNPTYTIDAIDAPDNSSTNVGSYQITVKFDENSDDFIFSSSDLIKTYGITPRSVTLKINSSKKYVENECPEFSYGSGGFSAINIVSTHSLDNTKLRCLYYEVGNYSFFEDGNSLNQFEWISSSYSGKGLPVIIDKDGNSVTDNYEISYQLYVSINYNSIEVSAQGYNGEYDGLYHGIDVTVDTLGDGFVIKYSTSQKGPYSTTCPMYKDVGAKLVYYMVTCEGYADYVSSEPESIIITKTKANLELDDPYVELGKTYDAIAIDNPKVNYDLYNETDKDDITISYVYEIKDDDGNYIAHSGPVVNVGEYRLTITFKDSKGNYEEENIIKTFSIIKREIKLYLNDMTGKASKTYDGTRWSIPVSDLIVENICEGHSFDSTSVIQTISVNAGYYNTTSHFEWQNGWNIFSNSGNVDLKDNYEITTYLDVTISKAKMTFVISNYEGTYDSKAHTIGVEVNNCIDDYTILYSSTGEEGSYSSDPITRTQVGTTTVYVMITTDKDNYEIVYTEGLITIEGLPIGTNSSDIHYDDDKEYDGENYNTPTLDTESSGKQTVLYYLASDTEKTNPLTSVKDAGNYFFVLTVETDGIYEEIVINQSFKISPKEVEVTWDDLSLEYTGKALLPKAYYTDIAGNNIDLGIKSEITSMINAKTYSIWVESNDSNYKLTNSKKDFVITKQKVSEPSIPEDMEFEYGEEITIKDINGNVYEIDSEGNITAIISYDEEGNITNRNEDVNDIPYKLVLSTDYNADGVVYTEHYLTIELKDKDNFMWKTNESTADISVKYVINPYDLDNHKDDYKLYTSLNAGMFEYTGEEIIPELTIYLQTTEEVVDEETGEVETLKKNIDLYDENCTTIPSDRFANYKVSYENNIEITKEGESAYVIITGINNISFNTKVKFTIVDETPKVITLTEDATIGFINIKFTYYDANGELCEEYDENGVYVFDFELDNVERTEDNKDNKYLGRLYQNTYISDIISQIANDHDHIEVYDSNGDIILTDKYELEYFGTGFKLVLVDDDGNEIDSIESILFGDIDGNGYIDNNDISKNKDFVNDSSSITGVYYYSTFVSFDGGSQGNENYSILKDYINDSELDFNIIFKN